MKLYERPDSYCGPEYYGCYPFIGRSRDSRLVESSNWKGITEELKKKFGPEQCGEYGNDGFCGAKKVTEAGKPTWFIIRDSHWAVGWVETLYIHQDAKEIVAWAEAVEKRLEGYPIYNEDLYSEMEMEEKAKFWQNCDKDERVALLKEAGLSGSKWLSKYPPMEVEDNINID